MSYNRSNAGAAALAHAETLVGKPYVFGGNYPPLGDNEGTDCSGLVQWAYHFVGVTLPRTSETQYKVAQIQLSAPREPGDCLFFTGAPSDPPPGHVGLYVGLGVIGPNQHTFNAHPKGAEVMFNAPFTDDPFGIRYDYTSDLGPELFVTRPALLLPYPTQRLIKGMTWTWNVPPTAGAWLVYNGRKAGIPDPADLTSIQAHAIPRKTLNEAQLNALKTEQWGAL